VPLPSPPRDSNEADELTSQNLDESHARSACGAAFDPEQAEHGSRITSEGVQGLAPFVPNKAALAGISHEHRLLAHEKPRSSRWPWLFLYAGCKMSEYRPARKRSSEPLFKFRQILILIALILVFAFAIRLVRGDPFPRDVRNFFASKLDSKHG
jgi:hypothetical protein